MDIKNLNSPAVNTRTSELNKSSLTDPANPAAVNTGKTDDVQDRVTLTDMQGQLRALEQKAQGVPDGHQERIAQLRDAINNGSYQVNAQKIADRLLQTETLFFRL